MFESYGHSQTTMFEIEQPDDSKACHTTALTIYSTYQIMPSSFRRDGLSCHRIYTNRNKHLKGDPVINEMKSSLRDYFGWGSRGFGKAPNKWKMAIVTPDKKMALMIEKGETYYNLMGQRIKKDNLLSALSRFIYTSCYEKDGIALLEYTLKLMSLPENVSYVLENKAPYWFFDIKKREKIECRLNVQLISSTEAAIEISDGIWAEITVNDLDMMVNHYYHGYTRSKRWRLVSPKKLWTMLMDSPPSDAQLKLMLEFLAQNRTQDIVEARAVQLMNSLEEKYPDRIKILNCVNSADKKHTVMLVRGKLADWVIVDNAFKQDTQKVKTYVFINKLAEEAESDDSLNRQRRHRSGNTMDTLGGSLRGPICIDNMHKNSSLGDQYASRALALLNDNVTIKLIYTIDRYIPKVVLDGKLTSRFGVPFESIDGENPDWNVII